MGAWGFGGDSSFCLHEALVKTFFIKAILLLSLVLATGRWLMIGWYPDYLGWLAIAQLLHAATFGGAHVVAIHLVHLYFGSQHQGKGQALYSSLSFGLGGCWVVFTALLLGIIGFKVCLFNSGNMLQYCLCDCIYLGRSGKC